VLFVFFGDKMNELGMRIAHHKRRGEWAELRFLERAAEQGLCVSKPWGETLSYDVVVEASGRLLRVQVKSTWSMNHGAYVLGIRNSRGAYPPGAFEVVAGYLIPLDVWYLLPECKVQGKATILLYPRIQSDQNTCPTAKLGNSSPAIPLPKSRHNR